VSHFEIFGNDDTDEQFVNIKLIFSRFEMIHFDISGNDDNDEQL